jgi:hypothetical protein
MDYECLICQPFAFWSSAAYLLAAFFLYRRLKTITPEAGYWLGGLILVTIASFFAHAAFTNLALAVDMASIINLTGFMHFPKFISKGDLKIRAFKFVSFFILLSVSLFMLPDQWWVPITTGFFLVTSINFWRRTPVKLHKEFGFQLPMIIYFLSFMLFLFDKEPWLCDISWMPYGHTIWHFGSALTAYLFGKWYFCDLPRKLKIAV